MLLRHRLIGFFVALTAISAVSGCADCQCAPPSAFLFVPGSRAPRLAGVVANGSTCDAMVSCTNASGLATTCTITMPREGTCRIEVVFGDGSPTFVHDVTFTHEDGCCTGFYPDENSRSIMVPTIEGDAGTGGADVRSRDDAASE